MKRWKIAVALLSAALVSVPAYAAGMENVQSVQAETTKAQYQETAVRENKEITARDLDDGEDDDEVVKSITIQKMPDNTEYLGLTSIYDMDFEGLQIRIDYESGSYEVLDYTDGEWEHTEGIEYCYARNIEFNYAGDYLDPDYEHYFSYGNQKVNISYGEKSAEIPIYIDQIKKLEVLSAPTAEYYEGYIMGTIMRGIGQILDLRGMEIRATSEKGKVLQLHYKRVILDESSFQEGWYDQNEELYEDCMYDSEYIGQRTENDGFAAGMQKARLEFEGATAEFNVKVKKVKSLTALSLPTLKEFYGETTDEDVINNKADGLKFQVNFEDGSTEIVSYRGEGRYGWINEDDELVKAEINLIYKGKYKNNKEGGYFAYGTWPVAIVVGSKSVSYNIDVKPNNVKKETAITVNQTYQFQTKEHQTNVYTFTPQETALYYVDYVENEDDSGSSCGLLIKAGNRVCGEFDSSWRKNQAILQAGQTYTFEFTDWYIDPQNDKITFSVKKEQNISATALREGTFDFSFTSEESNEKYYSFIPEATGTYVIQATNSYEDLAPAIKWYADDMNILLDSNELEFDEKWRADDRELECYLQKGQKYIFAVGLEAYTDDDVDGTFHMEIKQKKEDHEHVWKTSEEIPSSCFVTGLNIQKCEKCDIVSAAETPTAHTFGDYVVTVEATESKEGNEARTCSVCGYVENRTIPKLPTANNDSNDKNTTPNKPATDSNNKNTTPDKPATINLNVKSIVLKTGQSTTAVKVSGLTDGDAVVSWKSSKPAIVKVNNKGKITAGKKTGSAVLTVTLKSGKTATVKVKVQKKAVTTKKIKVNKKNVTLKKNKSYTIKATLNPITSSDKVKFTSSNKKVATVNAKGVVKAKKAGTAKITVKAGKKKAVVTVKVK